ncbi:MAG: AMP-binding protein [Fibrobacterales bacterium]
MPLFNLEYLDTLWNNSTQPIVIKNSNNLLWPEFKNQVLVLSDILAADPKKDWTLYTDSPGEFAIAFLALLYADKTIHLHNLKPQSNKCSQSTGILIDSDLSTYSILSKALFGTMNQDKKRTYSPNQQVILYTSGSTGQPKKVIKNLFQIENELTVISSEWGADLNDTTLYSTVSHQHYYGFLFSILMPILCKASINHKRIEFPESLIKLHPGPISFVTSPAFLKRMKVIHFPLDSIPLPQRIFSSGGFLPHDTAISIEKLFNTPVTEIYGSTETGGIGWKISPKCTYWTPFKCLTLTQKDNAIYLQSPYLENETLYQLDDILQFSDDGTFKLIGRTDSIVKIEENRIALNDMIHILLQSPFVDDAIVYLKDEHRQFLIAAIALNDKGQGHFKEFKKNDINIHFRTLLALKFHKTTLPKKWRFCQKIPRNSLGKINKTQVLELFNNKSKGPFIWNI